MLRTRTFAPLAALAFAAACSPNDDGRITAEAGGAVELAGAPAPADSAAAARLEQQAALHLVVAAGKNEARYRVRERLMGRELDNDAVGVTSDVSGGIAVDRAGAVIPALSRFTVQLAGLTSDQARRDNYLRRRLLQTDSFPAIVFAPTAVKGLPAAAVGAQDGAAYTFQLLGDLTVRGVTRPSVWQVTARREAGNVVGSAATAFTFTDFGLAQPRVPVVLSVADTIRLEYDFTLGPAR